MQRALLLLLLMLPVAAFAQDDSPVVEGETAPPAGAPRAETERAVLLWGPSSAVGKDAVARRALEDRVAADQPFPSRVLRISDWLGAARFRLGGSAVSIPCAAPPSELVEVVEGQIEIAALNQLGRKKLEELDTTAALEAFQDADNRIPCLIGFLNRETFWESYFYGGIAAFYAGQQKLAKQWFRQAAAVAPEKEWDSSYPPEPQSTFLSAVQDIVARPKGRVFGDMRGTNYVEVRLDGTQLDLTKAFEVQVNPGLHVIQAVDDRGRWSTWVRKLDEGGTLTFFSATGAEQMLLEGPDGVLKNLAAADLTRRAQEQRLDDIYLVTIDPDKEEATAVFAFSPEFQLWKRLETSESGEIRTSTEAVEKDPAAASAAGPELTPQEKRKAAFLREADYRSSATFGFKYFSLWRCTEEEAGDDGKCPGRNPSGGFARQNDYIGGLVQIDVRLYKGLNLDIRFGATIADFTDGGTVMPEFGAGFRYRFLQGVLQPYLGGSVDLLFGTTTTNTVNPSEDNEVAVYVGPIFYGGLDIEFPDGFRISIEGGGGVMIAGEGATDLNWPAAHALFSLGRFMP